MTEYSNRTLVEILGETFYVKNDPPDGNVNRTADFLAKQIKDIEYRYPNLSAKRLAILTAFNLADELTRLRDDYEQIVAILDNIRK